MRWNLRSWVWKLSFHTFDHFFSLINSIHGCASWFDCWTEVLGVATVRPVEFVVGLAGRVSQVLGTYGVGRGPCLSWVWPWFYVIDSVWCCPIPLQGHLNEPSSAEWGSPWISGRLGPTLQRIRSRQVWKLCLRFGDDTWLISDSLLPWLPWDLHIGSWIGGWGHRGCGSWCQLAWQLHSPWGLSQYTAYVPFRSVPAVLKIGGHRRSNMVNSTPKGNCCVIWRAWS